MSDTSPMVRLDSAKMSRRGDDVHADQNTGQRKTLLTGAIGFLMVLCCLAGPAVIGAIGGIAIGGLLGIAAAVATTLVAAMLLHWRSRKRGRAC